MTSLEHRDEEIAAWIDVPYEEHAEVRALGAHWDGVKRRWWVRGTPEGLQDFDKWLPSELFDFGAIFGGSVTIDLIGLPWDCVRCGSLATILVGMVKAGRPVSASSLVACEQKLVLRLADRVLPEEVRREWRVGPIRRRYSKTIQAAYLSNGCPHCGLIFGNFPVYHEEVPYVLATRGDAGFARMARVEMPESWWRTTLSDRFRY